MLKKCISNVWILFFFFWIMYKKQRMCELRFLLDLLKWKYKDNLQYLTLFPFAGCENEKVEMIQLHLLFSSC